ncbi:hypothetical protein L0F63_002273 [Massospora cicadina]|nr:hypothetical protein L0F63_002273 [Massospora cicadina]
METSILIDTSSQSQEMSAYEIESATSETSERIRTSKEIDPALDIPLKSDVAESMLKRLSRKRVEDLYVKRTEVIPIATDEASETLGIEGNTVIEADEPVTQVKLNAHKLLAPSICTPKRKPLLSSEDEVSSQEERHVDSQEESEKDEEDLDSDEPKIASESESSRIDSPCEVADDDNSGFREYSDSIIDEADFVVQDSSDEEQRGFEMLPELFSRGLGFRKDFEIFIEVLIRVSLNPSYIAELDTDGLTYRRYKDVVVKARSYCADLVAKHTWTKRFKDALFACPTYSYEELFSADLDCEDPSAAMASVLLEGETHDIDTLEPNPPATKPAGGRFSIPVSEAQLSRLCHELYHFNFFMLKAINEIAQKFDFNGKDLEDRLGALLCHFRRRGLISKWYSRFEKLLDEAAAYHTTK